MQIQVRRLLLLSTMLGAISAIPVSGQTFGEITGRISDPTGAAIPAAQITLTSVATNAVRVAASTDSGDHTFPAVAPGGCNVKVEKTAFKSASSADVQVQIQQTVRLDFTLQVGQVSESIEVSASAQMLQAENVSLGTVIENKGVTELPLNGRNYLGLVALASNTNTLSATSGQAAGHLGGDRANQSISVGGNRIMFDFYTLDGVSNTDPDFNTYVVLPSIDAIQEFKVQTGVYPAEFGHQSSQINVLTRSGGNAYHGSLFEFIRNDQFDAVPYAFTATHPVKSPFKWNDYGFEIDGPVRIPKLFDGRNRLFFMANDEWKVQRQNSQSTYSVPGTQSRHLQGFQDVNQAIPGTVGNIAFRTPYPGFSNIQLVHDGGNGSYDSLTVKATRRFSQGVSVISSYTWAKSIDTTSGIRNQGNATLYPQNSYCLSCERALSAFDTRHRMVTSVLYDLPVGNGKLVDITNPVLNAIIGSWQAGGILTLQSGMPGTLTIGGVDNASTGAGGYDRPNFTGISPYVDNPTASRYWNLAAFTEAPQGQFGNVGRNSIEGPGIIGFDAEVHKQFRMPYKEGHVLQFRFEAFNALNHPNWSMPTLNILSGAAQPGLPATAAHQNFGVVSGTSTAMRQIQLGLKYSF